MADFGEEFLAEVDISMLLCYNRNKFSKRCSKGRRNWF